MMNPKQNPAGDVRLPLDSSIKSDNHGGAATAHSDLTIENVTATKQGFPIVGIGASAGGLAAFEAFFLGMPADADPGMAFVLIQHLAPDHDSILTEIIRRYTRMEVFEVENGMKVKPNCVYIIPPNRDMAFLDGSLQLLEPLAPHGHRLPIDFFFRSLAQNLKERSICIVLSGTGSDGTQGVRAIKGEGGMVMVQNIGSAEYDGMPRSAIATGIVDYELSPAEMPAQLIAYVSHAFGKLSKVASSLEQISDSLLKKIYVLLQNRTGHDFSQYKPNTVNRRIERRLAVHQINSIDGYVKYLQQTPAEIDALFRDLLIGVTNFFRDPEAFKALEEQVIFRLFNNKPVDAVIRIWLPGCSTGEEAYSIAILLQERMDTLKKSYKVQIFATDIDSNAIATGRAGVYPASISADVSPERLAHFFINTTDDNTFRINKNIRDMVIFSEHDVIKDPPFSKLDIISCRNLLIYMGGDLQKKLIPLFHYALNPDGILFLGSSESISDFSDLFITLDRKAKLFQAKKTNHDRKHLPLSHLLTPVTTMKKTALQAPGKTILQGEQTLREITEQTLLKQVAPAAMLVKSNGDILYLHGRTGKYLEPTPGETGVHNILKMAREGLLVDLAAALHKAAVTKETVYNPNLRVKTNGDFTMVNLAVRPVPASPSALTDEPLFLCILTEALPTTPAMSSLSQNSNVLDETTANTQIVKLQHELQANKEHLQTTIGELQTSNEELKSSNEEMQSMNEELQSTNEEMETSREELQSVNEELSTVNAELQTKLADLSNANNDMNNLLAGTNISTVFVDIQLHIKRFTPTATRIINLIQSDVGRPVAHVVTNLAGYSTMVADIKTVLDTLIPKEVEVQTTVGKWYTMRIQPYRTLDNVIEGAVITFVDITEMKKTREALSKANELDRLAIVVRDAHDAISMQDMEGRILAWNPGAVKLYGWSEAEALAMNVRDRIPKELREKELAMVHQLSQTEILKPYHTQRIAKDGTIKEISMTSTALVNEAGRMYAIATTERALGLRGVSK